tara:strand:+ start:52 stop:1962 length:1911 start_codon:yes stop_codon:yes gene_type:complete
MNRFLLFFIFFSLLSSQSRITVNSKSQYLIYKKTIVEETYKKNNSGSEEEKIAHWTVLTMFLIDYAQKYDPDPAGAYDIINSGLYQIVEGITVGDIQKNPSKYTMHMYILKKYITIKEYLITEEDGSFINPSTWDIGGQGIQFSDKIEMIDQLNNILIEENTNQSIQDYFIGSLDKKFDDVKKTGEHAGYELIFEAGKGKMIQYLFFETKESIDNHFQIYLFEKDNKIQHWEDLYFKVIDVYMDEHKYPFFFRDGKSILHEKILLFEKYLAYNFDSKELGRQFHDLLIQPIIDENPDFLEEVDWQYTMTGGMLINKVTTIIPDTPIRNIPFEALIAPKAKFADDLDFAGPIYLVKKYSFHYANSVRELVQNSKYMENSIMESDTWQFLLDKFGNDLSGISDDEVEIVKKQMMEMILEELKDQENDVRIFAGVDYQKFTQNNLKNFGISNISDLKFVSEEVNNISHILSKIPCCEAIVNSPTETDFKKFQFSNKLDIVHIAMHGISDNKDYRKSSLLFEPDDKNNGFLEFREIINLKIPARLIVLSACETNRGQDFTNMHSLSLQRAFKATGVENVIGTLWAIDDKVTAEFMAYFYTFLFQQDNKNISMALALAKMLTLDTNLNPHYWAGFVQYGNR